MSGESGGGPPGNEPLHRRPLEPPLQQGEEDEPPGSYLAELGPGRANIVWGAINLGLVIAVGAIDAALGISPGSPWYALSRLVWSLLPISAILLGIVTFWQGGNAYASPAPGRAMGSIALAAASLALWLVFRFVLDVLPAS